MKYQFIEQHKHEFPIVVMCNVLGVSESGFYARRKRPACQHKREDAQRTCEIRQVFVTHRGRYGGPRIHRELKDQGRSTSRKRVARLMREADMSARRPPAPGVDHPQRHFSSGGSQRLKSRVYGRRA